MRARRRHPGDPWRLSAALLLGLAPVALLGCGGHEAGNQADDPQSLAERSPGGPAAEPDWTALLPNARQPAPGVVTGGQPTLEQLRQARDAGFTTVINLRAAGEPGTGREDVEALGMRYVPIPVDGTAGVTEANARALSWALEEADGPVIVHCGSGNRVGALFALKAFHVDGRSAQEALDLGLEAGLTRLEPVVRRHLDGAVD